MAANYHLQNQIVTKHTGQLNIVRAIDSNNNYLLLTTDGKCFMKRLQESLICMLCGTREPWRASKIHPCSESHLICFDKFKLALLSQIPDDSSLQMNAVKEYLDMNYYNCCLDEAHYNQRAQIIQDFRYLLERLNPECSVRETGSFLTGTSLVTSNINLELVHPNSKLFKKDPRAKSSIHHRLVEPEAEIGQQFNEHFLKYDLVPNAMETLFRLMMSINNPYNNLIGKSYQVVSNPAMKDLTLRVPKLILRHVPTNTTLEISCYNDSNYRLSKLLKTYLSLDYRARLLSNLVKFWAKLCRIDNPDHGTFPPDTYLILVIYFLQRTDPPILPCLHKIFADKHNSGSNLINKSNNCDSRVQINHLMDKLVLTNDVTSVSDNELQTNGLVTGSNKKIENGTSGLPEKPQDNLIWEDEFEDDDDEDDAQFEEDEISNINWSTSNIDSYQNLFIQFLKYMMDEFYNLNNVISIRTLEKIPLLAKGWNTRIKPIENPIKPNINISRCIGSQRTFEYIRKCFKRAFYYLLSVPLDMRLKQRLDNPSEPQDFRKLYFNTKRMNNYFQMKWASSEDSTRSSFGKNISEMIQQNLFAHDVVVINNLFDSAQNNPEYIKALPRSVANLYVTSFFIPNDSIAATFCWYCKMPGHSRRKCPKAQIEDLSDEHKHYDIELDSQAELDPWFEELFERDTITTEIAYRHESVRAEIENVIVSSLGIACKITRFGSTVNNLGSFDSDIDLCLTLDGNSTGKGVNCVEILHRVSIVLRKTPKVSQVEPVLKARVPIVRLKYDEFDVDLSMYNHCAIFNSELLRTYSLVDDRVAKLIYLVKRYAKACGIADASKGTLSSYAWSLMVIHFLQNTDPPILPVLQESEDPDRDRYGVNGWNVWFNNQISNLNMEYNGLSLTTLFKDFFLYFGLFDFDYYVISIRKSKRITRLQKSWNNCMIAIEDPFELTYNLASRLDEPMATFIINSFSLAYKHLLRIQRYYLDQESSSTLDIEARLFDQRAITSVSPPYRGCITCHRIGHKVKDCPEKQKLHRSPKSRPRK